MKQFPSIQKLDSAILYTLELASSLSIILLVFGLIASMANVLNKGSVLSASLIMQRIWAWTQCVAIDASMVGTIIRTYCYFSEKSWAKFALYAFLSCLLLFTVAIVSNIESVQQTLSITLDSAYTHVFVPVEALIWMRSFVIVLLIVAHALRHVQTQEHRAEQKAPPLSVVTPEFLNDLRALLSQPSVSEKHQVTPQIPATTTATDDSETPPVTLFPTVTDEERNKVIEAYTKGIPRCEICSYLRWGSAKYTTIVKPVLDAYEQQERPAGNGQEHQ